MSVYRDLYAMVAVPIPEDLWKVGHDGFYKKHEVMIDHVRSGQIGAAGILFDGMNLEHCLFGVVVGFRSGMKRNPPEDQIATLRPLAVAKLAVEVDRLYEAVFERPSPGSALHVLWHHH